MKTDCTKSTDRRCESSWVLAVLNGLTAEELDFVLNYDLEYHLGRDTWEGAEE